MTLPGSTIGMLGGGQLGRMFTMAARSMGYEVIVLDPDPDSPAGKLATDHVCANYNDQTASTTWLKPAMSLPLNLKMYLPRPWIPWPTVAPSGPAPRQ